MDFRRRTGEEPEINLIPLIDVLLVVIIFLILTTTYTRYAGLEISLPSAEAETHSEQQDNQIDVAITASGQILVNKEALQGNEVKFITEALSHAANGRKDPMIIISGDAKATHQSVIDVMQAAQAAGFPRISFTTQSLPQQGE
ncbi:MAG: biopolymer transporter ExbD [Zoogloeaceae bacterium]|jgi:biopolymer transport protein ExbD|nr:biopolymer transporter ExbD [Zoogloeaceae bacterium]